MVRTSTAFRQKHSGRGRTGTLAVKQARIVPVFLPKQTGMFADSRMLFALKLFCRAGLPLWVLLRCRQGLGVDRTMRGHFFLHYGSVS
jgi:hypothetical protein